MIKMIKKDEKHLDIELLIAFFFCAITFFIFYVIRNFMPTLIPKEKNINYSVLLSLYSIDLLTFLIILIPYLTIVITLVAIKIIKKVKISDNIIIILFFPLLSFFTKGMGLWEIYIEENNFDLIKAIIKDNLSFFAFLFIGPLIVIVHKVVIRIIGKRKVI
jgi:hypothetical protein